MRKFLFPLLVAALLGCAAEKPHSTEVAGGGETDISASESPLPPMVFPHLENWASPSAHGAWVVEYTSTVCFSCHQDDAATGEGAPGCRSCHSLFPHGSDWVKKENHGATVLKNGKQNCATQCHGSNLGGGLSGVSCHLCHTLYPHTDDWMGPAQHGVAAKGEGRLLCKGCHGDDLTGGDAGTSCYQCHDIFPHENDWGNPTKHGAKVISKGKESCMTECHGTDLKGGISNVACDSCHKVYPHAGGWEKEHGKVVSETGSSVCQGCHGEDLKGGNTGVSCDSCHEEYPHPDSSKWLPFTGGHGEKVKTKGGTDSCKKCHGDDLKNPKNEKTCFSCHPSYPHKEMSPAWKEFAGHGEYALQHTKTECQVCHGSDYHGGERKNPSCYQCHVSYPHGEGWLKPKGEPQGHGTYVTLQSSASCATAECHGENLVPVSGVTHGPGCNSCHSLYPHAADWSEGIQHGKVALSDITLCKGCHGEKLDFVPKGFKTCQECHPSYLKHKTAGLGGEGWGVYGGHGKFIPTDPLTKKKMIDECKLCHGQDLAGGIADVSCKNCHPSYPHSMAPDWKEKEEHGFYVVETLKGNKGACKACHGNDLKGGKTGVSCFNCHASYPHDIDWKLPVKHGLFVTQTLKSDTTTCQTCHGEDLKGGISKVSCSSCHKGIYPHEGDWKSPTQHGIYVLENLKNNKSSCQKCHGIDLKGGISKVSCYGCHTTFTHNAVWGKGTGHGDYLMTTLKNDKSSCQTCHGNDLKGGASKVSCTSCHANYPHETGWKLPANHGIFVLKDLKNDKSSCQKCHGANLKGGISKVSCYQGGCHAGLPGSGFTHEGNNWGNPTEHGIYVVKNLKSDKSSCKECHGGDLKGGEAGISCTGCHATITHEGGWKEPAGHGGYLLTTLKKNTSSCKLCHGGDLQGGVTGVSCNKCHAGYPHESGWKEGEKHGVAAKGEGKKSCAGAGCHKADLSGDAALGVPSCTACHQSYPHASDWKNPDKHGVFVLKDLKNDKSSCKGCHGNDLKGGISQVSCSGCHAIYPHEAGWVDWKKHGVEAMGNKESCQGCHKKDLSGDAALGIPGCDSCHPGYSPHGEPIWYSDPKTHGTYLLGTAGNNKSLCKACHGENLKGGITGVSCYTCHYDYPHPEVGWTASGKASGHAKKFVQKMKDGIVTACQMCHGENYDVVLAGISCKGCHPKGVTHTTKKEGENLIDWSDPSQHGKFYSSQFTAMTYETEANCKDCHGSPYIYDGLVYKNGLKVYSDCYGCHWAYPHVGYKVQGKADVWEPAANGPTGLGHVYFLMNPPGMVVDSTGKSPTHMDDPVLITPSAPGVIPALQYTCGGDAASNCHYDGYRSKPKKYKTLMCSAYCHKP